MPEEIKPKFKEGDLVKIINQHYVGFKYGDIVKVLIIYDYEPENGGWYCRVAKLEDLEDFRGAYEDELELVSEEKGVLLGNRLTDWKAGAITGIEYQELNPSGDWSAYLPKEEWQWFNNGLDVLACVTFSALSSLETLIFFHTGKQINFSDRYTAWASGTTHNGNYMWKVGDSIRKDGLVEEALWAAIPAEQNPQWNDYYTAPPIEVINKAKEFLNDWQVNYEFIDFTKESLIKHLKQAPIQVVFPNHAVMLFSTTEQVYKYFDSYAPFIKERSEGFVSAMKYVINKKTKMLNLYKEKDRWATYAKINDKYYYIGAKAMIDLVAAGLANQADIKEVDEIINFTGVIK